MLNGSFSSQMELDTEAGKFIVGDTINKYLYNSPIIHYLDNKRKLVGDRWIREVTGKLIDDVKLDKRSDKENIIYLIEEMDVFGYDGMVRTQKNKELNLEYKGQLYKWKHWNE